MAAATEQPKPAPAQPAQPAPPPAKPANDDALTSTAAAEQSSATGTEGTEAEGKDEDAIDLDVGPETGSVVDMDVFGQLLEIDDDDTHEFSKTLAFDYINQAEATFVEIEEALSKKDLDALSRKGHFLKGSSAALGLQRVQHLCEALQHFGKRRDARGEGPEVSEEEALARCKALLGRLKKNQKEAKDWLEGFYKEKA
ncbi:Phosphorelay intermediate protein [Rhodotorula toruloides]